MSQAASQPDLAVIVLAVRAPDEIADALASLDRQSVPVEVVVVNSGGGDVNAVIGPSQTKWKVLNVPELLWPGAARNLGIENSTARWVSFMASDHIALSNWAAERLVMHRAGHRAVASAVTNNHPRNIVAWAHHLSILVRRLPGVPTEEAHLYGVSYDRALFDEFGLFRPDLRIGEDTEFNQRLKPEDQPVWAPSVQVTHRNTTRFIELIKDQFRRGRRYGFHWGVRRRRRLWTRIFSRFFETVSLSFVSVRGVERLYVVASWPLLFFAVTAYDLGVRAGVRDKKNASDDAS